MMLDLNCTELKLFTALYLFTSILRIPAAKSCKSGRAFRIWFGQLNKMLGLIGLGVRILALCFAF